MKIRLCLDPVISQSQTFFRHIHMIGFAAMEDGQECEFLPETDLKLADVVVIQDNQLEKWRGAIEGNVPFPYIILERKDGAGLTGIVNELLCGPRPPAVIWKNCVYEPLALYNAFHGRRQEQVCREAFGIPTQWDLKPPARLLIHPDRLPRIRYRFGFGAYSPAQFLASFPKSMAENRDRPIDVSFAGTVDYDIEALARHRRAACDQIEKLAGRFKVEVIRGRDLGQQQYAELLFRSKCVVCPWGFGEATHRYYEAVFAGCVPIAPWCQWISETQYAFKCDAAFSDLQTRIEGVRYAWNDPDCYFWHDRREFLKWHSPHAIGRRLWQDIKEAVNGLSN